MHELSAIGISAGYDGPLILQDVSLSVSTGEISVVLGPNGAGKSTLAKAMVGLLPIKSGRVELRGADVTGLPPYQLVRHGLAYLPQLMNVFDRMSVIENLEMGGYTTKGVLRERVTAVFDLFPDLAKDRKKRAGALSGGQQRMLALARMLMTEPTAAILDEPTSGLSPIYAERVWEQIEAIGKRGVGLMVVEQNASVAIEHAHSVTVLAQGRIAISGAASELKNHDDVARILVG